MIKYVKGHDGYYICDRCIQAGEIINGRIISKEIDAEEQIIHLEIN